MSSPSPVSVERISRIIESVLGVPVPDAQANIIGLGANSMEIVRIINRLEDELGFRPRFEDLSACPTVTALATAYENVDLNGGTVKAGAISGSAGIITNTNATGATLILESTGTNAFTGTIQDGAGTTRVIKGGTGSAVAPIAVR